MRQPQKRADVLAACAVSSSISELDCFGEVKERV